MSEEQYKLLKWLTYGTYNELFEVIDDDGIRKPAIITKIRDVWASPKGDKNFNAEEYLMTIDWRLLDRWRTKCDDYSVGNPSEEEMAAQMKKRYGIESYSNLEPQSGINVNHIPSKEDKAVADKAAKLIARDYGETLRKLCDE